MLKEEIILNLRRSTAITAIEAIIAMTFLGSVPVAIRLVEANAYTVGIVRLSFGAIGILIYGILKNKINKPSFKSLSQKDKKFLFIIGLFFGLHWLTYFISIKISSASIAAIGLSSYGINLLLLGHFFDGSKIKINDIFCIALAICGCILVAFKIPFIDSFDKTETSIDNKMLSGFLVAILSGVFYSFLPIMHKRISHVEESIRIFSQFSFAFIPFLFFTKEISIQTDFKNLALLIYLGFFCTLITHSLWVRVITKLHTKTTSIVNYTYVPISVMLSFLLLDEKLKLSSIIGGSLIISGNIFAAILKRNPNNR